MDKQIIFDTKDIRVIPDVMRMIVASRVNGLDLAEVELFIRAHLGKPDSKLWIAFDGSKINGFLFAYIVFPAVKPEVFIAWAYMDPKQTKTMPRLLGMAEHWARSLGIGRISTFVRKNLKAYEKKYGFKLEYYGMAKDLMPKEGSEDERTV